MKNHTAAICQIKVRQSAKTALDVCVVPSWASVGQPIGSYLESLVRQHCLSQQTAHGCKDREHHILERSRNRVSAGKVLMNCQPSKPEHEPELRDQ
jgi:hypothetical protein